MSRGMWTHDLFMDVRMLILKCQYRGPDYIKIKVEWFVRDRSLLIKQNVKLFTKDRMRWKPI